MLFSTSNHARSLYNFLVKWLIGKLIRVIMSKSVCIDPQKSLKYSWTIYISPETTKENISFHWCWFICTETIIMCPHTKLLFFMLTLLIYFVRKRNNSFAVSTSLRLHPIDSFIWDNHIFRFLTSTTIQIRICYFKNRKNNNFDELIKKCYFF